MKKIYIKTRFLLLFLFLSLSIVKAENASFYFGEGKRFNTQIPSPEQFFGYGIGSRLTHYYQLVAYFEELDRLSDHAELKVIGETYEGKPLLVLIISDKKNLAKLEQIRTDHLKVLDPKSTFDQNTLPAISFLGFGVHGNESSAPEAAILTAYYLLASEEKEVADFLENGVFFIEPSRNPDGLDRHAHWVNTQKSKNLVADPADLEHNETYPGGRTNHYWFDLNRDWLPAIHPESRARLKFYHSWVPQVATCHHEMGTNSTFFFEPTKPVDRESPIVPRNHYELNNKFANYYADALNKIGSLYYTKEDFDNFNPTFGSSYPDYNGSLAILFEQGSSRGIIQERKVGIISFSQTIRNQFTASLASVKASVELKPELVENQKYFFKTAYENGSKSTTKGYIFGDENDQTRTLLLAQLLKRHRVEVLQNDKDTRIGNQTFKAGKSFLVSTEQAQNRLVELFFNKDIQVPDSVFYDGSTWTVAFAYGLPFSPVSDKSVFSGKASFEGQGPTVPVLNKSDYAYLVRWTDYNSPAVLSNLFKKEVVVNSALKPFSSKINDQVVDFGAGTLVIPVTEQKLESNQLFKVLADISSKYAVEIVPVNTGYNVKGIDLGSNNVVPLIEPKILILTGRGISSSETGEAWFLIDNHLDIPVTRADITGLSRLELKRYNTIVLPGTAGGSGNTLIDKAAIQRLKNWISEGGTLIALNNASEWVIKNDLVNEKIIPVSVDTTLKVRLNYSDLVQSEGSKVVGGTILKADVDFSHPIGFGFTSRELAVLKNNTLTLRYSNNAYNTIAAFGETPWVSGYISAANLKRFTNSAVVVVSPVQSGRVILFGVNPIHRASWFNSAKLFYNSIFFGSLAGGGRERYRASEYE